MKFFTWLGATSGKKRMSISPAVVCSSATLSLDASVIFRFSFGFLDAFGVAGGGADASALLGAVSVASLCVFARVSFVGAPAKHASVSAMEISRIKVAVLLRSCGANATTRTEERGLRIAQSS